MTDQGKYENPYRFIDDKEIVTDSGVGILGAEADFHGLLYIDYDKLCEVLGPPNCPKTEENPLNVQWTGTINGKKFNIGHWKDRPMPTYTSGTPIQWVKDWFVRAEDYTTYCDMDQFISETIGEN